VIYAVVGRHNWRHFQAKPLVISEKKLRETAKSERKEE
jgi:Fe-S cluster biosynthesis and repair protein YggX